MAIVAAIVAPSLQVIVTLLKYPRLPHGFASLTHLYPAGRRALAEIGSRTAELAEASASPAAQEIGR